MRVGTDWKRTSWSQFKREEALDTKAPLSGQSRSLQSMDRLCSVVPQLLPVQIRLRVCNPILPLMLLNTATVAGDFPPRIGRLVDQDRHE